LSKERRKRSHRHPTAKPEPEFFIPTPSDLSDYRHVFLYPDREVRLSSNMGNIGGRFSTRRHQEVSPEIERKKFSLGYQIRQNFEEAGREIHDGTIQNTIRNIFKEQKG